MTAYNIAAQEIKKRYGGRGWASIFTSIRLFITAPFQKLEAYIPREGFIVDLGCGYGIFANLLGLMSEKRNILGMDLDAYKMRYADKGLPNVAFKLADITQSDIPPADCILLIHVLHHLDSYAAQEPLLRACLGKLKTGGKLIIAEINRAPFWKLLLTKFADRILYRFHRPYYPYPEIMLPLLGRLGVAVQVDYTMHRGTPFSHVAYICTKQ